jgi:DNA-binding transcriptional LysR family regulator
MFDWENLRFFCALVRAGTLSGAARSLAVEHSTVSRRVAALEAQLDARLLEHLPRRIALTTIGQQVYALATEMETGAFAIQRSVRSSHSEFVGRVVVSAPPVFVTNFFAPAASLFRQKYPEIELCFTSEPNIVSLSKREADIAVRLSRPTENEYVAKQVGIVQFLLYASRNYPHISSPHLWEFVAYESSYDKYPHQQAIEKFSGNRATAFRANDITSQLAAAIGGVGVALLPRFCADNAAGLICVSNADESFSLDIWLAVHKELKDSAPIKAVRTFIAKLVTDSGHFRPTTYGNK